MVYSTGLCEDGSSVETDRSAGHKALPFDVMVLDVRIEGTVTDRTSFNRTISAAWGIPAKAYLQNY